MIEINSESDKADIPLSLNPTSLQNAVFKKLQQLHGDYGVAAITIGFRAKYCNEKTRIAVVRVRHGPHKLVASCLPCINTIDSKKVTLDTLYTGATLRHCFKFILNHQQKKVDEFCATITSEEERNIIKKSLLNLKNLSKID